MKKKDEFKDVEDKKELTQKDNNFFKNIEEEFEERIQEIKIANSTNKKTKKY